MRPAGTAREAEWQSKSQLVETLDCDEHQLVSHRKRCLDMAHTVTVLIMFQEGCPQMRLLPGIRMTGLVVAELAGRGQTRLVDDFHAWP